MVSEIIQEGSKGTLHHRFEYERINEVFADSEFGPGALTDIAAEPEKELVQKGNVRFVKVVDGSGTGVMRVKWGEKGSKGAPSGGLN